MEEIVIHLLENMREAWAQVIDIQPRLEMMCTDSQNLLIVPNGEAVTLIILKIIVGDIEGMIPLCIPYSAIEPIIGKL